MAPRTCFTVLLAYSLGILAVPPAAAFSNESIRTPAKGQVVSKEITFYIDAAGHRDPSEQYRIEVASDSDFRKIVATFDMQKQRGGWTFGDMLGLKDVPEKYIPENFEGIHYRAFTKLPDGQYWWRASKSLNGGGWEPIRGVETFTIDTVPPQPINDMTMRKLPDGRLQLHWQPVYADEQGNPESVSGFRVYRFPKPLRRYPLMTRYLVGEVQDAEITIPVAADSKFPIVFFFVQAVDQVGNEEGRRRPAPIGSFQAELDPPDIDLLLDRDYRRQLLAQDQPGAKPPPAREPRTVREERERPKRQPPVVVKGTPPAPGDPQPEPPPEQQANPGAPERRQPPPPDQGAQPTPDQQAPGDERPAEPAPAPPDDGQQQPEPPPSK